MFCSRTVVVFTKKIEKNLKKTEQKSLLLNGVLFMSPVLFVLFKGEGGNTKQDINMKEGIFHLNRLTPVGKSTISITS